MFHPVTLLPEVESRIQPPVAILLGSPRMVVDLAIRLRCETVCYQLDLHQANKLRQELAESGLSAEVVSLPDLWDLPAKFQTALFPVMTHGERELKLDLLEQSFHILVQGGMLLSLSEYERDSLLPKWHKKIFGKCSELPASKAGSVFWSYRDGDRPKRRHELEFHAKLKDGTPHTFLSRPGVFSYGRMDEGARALLDVAEMAPNDSILDLGCGVGTNGVLATERCGKDAKITFVDSNVRATALTDWNAKQNGLTNYQVIASHELEGLEKRAYDVILANPPYYANSFIAQMFIHRSKELLKPGGSFYLVTKQVHHVAPTMVECFGEIDAYETRNYHVLQGTLSETIP